MELYDCSIDDMYRSTTPAAAYQYTLGGTWVVSIFILSIMYGFIIYKINMQKKRRERLSNQSYDSTVFNRLKKLSAETHSGDKNKDVPKPILDNSLFINTGPNVATSERLQPSEATVYQCELTNGVSLKGGNKKHINRLFSRDVNPVFESTEDNGEVNDGNVCDSDDENVSFPDSFDNARLIKYARTSLNNYLASSHEADLADRSTSLIQTVTQEEAGIDQNDHNSAHRSRKCGHSFGRTHSWESDKLMRELSIINPALERGWTSESDDVPAATKVPDYDFVSGMRRTLSQSNLESAGREPSGTHIGKDEWLHGEEQPHGIDNEAVGSNKILNQLEPSNNKCSDETCATFLHQSVSQNTLPQNSVPVNITCDCSHSLQVNSSSGDDSYTINNSLQDSHNMNESIKEDMHQTSDSLRQKTNLHCSDCPKLKVHPVSKYRTASIVDTIKAHIKKKRSTTREIKTSRVSFMMLMVTAGFVLSYLPHLGIQIFKSLYPTMVARLLCTSHAYFVLHHLLMRFFFINNAINPIIYSFYNKTFRERCLRLLKSPRSLLQSSEHYISNIHSISQDNDTS